MGVLTRLKFFEEARGSLAERIADGLVLRRPQVQVPP